MKPVDNIQITITPGKALNGTYSLPGDKSISHRAALFGALAEGKSVINNFLVAGVTRAMLDAISALGVQWELDGNQLTIQGSGLTGLHPSAEPLDCGNSATTMRLLTGALAGAGIPAVLTGTHGLRRRPMNRIVQPLLSMGVPVQASGQGTAPLILDTRNRDHPLRALDYTLAVASAQVKTCLLIAALDADGPTTLYEPGPSRDHTERMLASMGVSVVKDTHQQDGLKIYETRLSPARPLKLEPLNITIPGDISAAAFLIVAALVTPDSEITLKGLGLNPTRTGLLDVLRQMGAYLQVQLQGEVHGEPFGDLTVRYSKLSGIEVKGPMVVRMIDEFPAFAIAAACATGRTIVREAEELRYKESDRIAALCQELNVIGVNAQETPDGFILSGGDIPGGSKVDSHADHRLAMALAVSGLTAREPVIVEKAGAIDESFPDFIFALRSLGARVGLEAVHRSG